MFTSLLLTLEIAPLVSIPLINKVNGVFVIFTASSFGSSSVSALGIAILKITLTLFSKSLSLLLIKYSLTSLNITASILLLYKSFFNSSQSSYFLLLYFTFILLFTLLSKSSHIPTFLFFISLSLIYLLSFNTTT